MTTTHPGDNPQWTHRRGFALPPVNLMELNNE
jgi:hypothetical protein